MLDIKYIRKHPDLIQSAVRAKNIDLNVDKLLSLDKELILLKKEEQNLNRLKNENAGLFKKAVGDKEKHKIIQAGRDISEKIEKLQIRLKTTEEKFDQLLWRVPNIASKDTPVGQDETFNKVIREEGNIKNIPGFKSHIEILTKNNWADFQNIAQVSGSRSYALKNQAVFLEQAFLQMGLHVLQKKGFEIMSLPNFGNKKAFLASGHFPEGEDQVYHLEKDSQYLTGTSEVILNSLYHGEILPEEKLPMLLGGLSPCFRREAGSAGRDVRGLLRVHQFVKLEQFVICKNDEEESQKWHDFLLKTSEEILKALELSYRVVQVCTAEMGAGKYRMHDIECWLYSLKKYIETHSCSSLLDWQARRTSLRYRGKNGKVQYCHTLNNTALALPRLLAVFLEQHQAPEGLVHIPQALRPFLGNQELLKP